MGLFYDDTLLVLIYNQLYSELHGDDCFLASLSVKTLLKWLYKKFLYMLLCLLRLGVLLEPISRVLSMPWLSMVRLNVFLLGSSHNLDRTNEDLVLRKFLPENNLTPESLDFHLNEDVDTTSDSLKLKLLLDDKFTLDCDSLDLSYHFLTMPLNMELRSCRGTSRVNLEPILRHAIEHCSWMD